MSIRCGLCKNSKDVSGRSELAISLKDPHGDNRIKLEISSTLCGQCLEKYEELISMMPYLFYKMAYIDGDEFRKYVNEKFEIEWAKTGKSH